MKERIKINLLLETDINHYHNDYSKNCHMGNISLTLILFFMTSFNMYLTKYQIDTKIIWHIPKLL